MAVVTRVVAIRQVALSPAPPALVELPRVARQPAELLLV
jgi:hypothetical protein